MTKSALEALVNALLAPSQPITANGMHKPSMQHVIDELYDAQSRGDVLAGVAAVLTLMAGDGVLIFRSGAAKVVPSSAFVSGAGAMIFCGAYDLSATNDYPTTGGSGPGGDIVAGNIFYVSVAGTLDLGGGAEDIVVKSLLVALVDDPADDPANWRLI